MSVKSWIFLVLGMIFATFIVQNSDPVPVKFLFWQTNVSRALILLGTFILGLGVGWLSGRVGLHRARSPKGADRASS